MERQFLHPCLFLESLLRILREQGLSCSCFVLPYPTWLTTSACFCTGFQSTARPPSAPLVLLQGDSEVPGCRGGGLARVLLDKSTHEWRAKHMYLKKGSKDSERSCCGDDLTWNRVDSDQLPWLETVSSKPLRPQVQPLASPQGKEWKRSRVV